MEKRNNEKFLTPGAQIINTQKNIHFYGKCIYRKAMEEVCAGKTGDGNRRLADPSKVKKEQNATNGFKVFSLPQP